MNKRRPRWVAITSPPGGGKTTVGATLASQEGVAVIDSDELVHRIYGQPNATYQRVLDAFGADLVDMPLGPINRRKLAALVLADPAKLARLEEIVHPRVREMIFEEIAKLTDKKVVFVQVPLLFEKNMEGDYDLTWAIVSNEADLIARLIPRPGIGTEIEARRRLSLQLPQEEKARRADVVIPNTGTLADLQERVLKELRRCLKFFELEDSCEEPLSRRIKDHLRLLDDAALEQSLSMLGDVSTTGHKRAKSKGEHTVCVHGSDPAHDRTVTVGVNKEVYVINRGVGKPPVPCACGCGERCRRGCGCQNDCGCMCPPPVDPPAPDPPPHPEPDPCRGGFKLSGTWLVVALAVLVLLGLLALVGLQINNELNKCRGTSPATPPGKICVGPPPADPGDSPRPPPDPPADSPPKPAPVPLCKDYAGPTQPPFVKNLRTNDATRAAKWTVKCKEGGASVLAEDNHGRAVLYLEFDDKLAETKRLAVEYSSHQITVDRLTDNNLRLLRTIYQYNARDKLIRVYTVDQDNKPVLFAKFERDENGYLLRIRLDGSEVGGSIVMPPGDRTTLPRLFDLFERFGTSN